MYKNETAKRKNICILNLFQSAVITCPFFVDITSQLTAICLQRKKLCKYIPIPNDFRKTQNKTQRRKAENVENDEKKSFAGRCLLCTTKTIR